MLRAAKTPEGEVFAKLRIYHAKMKKILISSSPPVII